MFKKGFTMSEMLICLALIACLAAMLIPQIVNKRPNKEKAMFRKAYYIAERVVSELINNDELYPSDLDDREGFAYYDTETSSVNNTGVTFCNEFAKKVNTNGEISCATSHVLGTTNSTPTFSTNDGVDWYFVGNKFCDPEYDEDKSSGCSYPSSSTPACPTAASQVLPYTCVYLDVNGKDNNPNTFSGGQTTDRFKLYIYYNGKIQIDNNSPAVNYLKSKTIF
jgi:prepilin-type N-terminal cleavage/methylation domain-containing protein